MIQVNISFQYRYICCFCTSSGCYWTIFLFTCFATGSAENGVWKWLHFEDFNIPTFESPNFLFVCPIFNSHIIISLSELSESLLLWISDISGCITQYEMLCQMSGLEFWGAALQIWYVVYICHISILVARQSSGRLVSLDTCTPGYEQHL